MISYSTYIKLLPIYEKEYSLLKRKFIHKYQTFSLELESGFSKLNKIIELEKNNIFIDDEGIISLPLQINHINLKTDKKSEIVLKVGTQFTYKNLWDRNISEKTRINIFRCMLQEGKVIKSKEKYLNELLEDINNSYQELLQSMEDLVKTLIYFKNSKGVIKFKKRNYIGNYIISTIFISSDNYIYVIIKDSITNNTKLGKLFSDLSYYDQCTIVNKLLSK